MIIDGREYGPGIHTVNGERIHVIDASTCVSLGKAPEPKPKPEPIRRKKKARRK